MNFVKKPFFLISLLLGLPLIGLLTLRFLPRDQPDPRLVSPVPQIGKLLESKATLFLSPQFLSLLPENQRSQFPSIQEAEGAVRDKSTFWKLNREHHFSTLLLGDYPADSDLANALLLSHLWVLTDVSSWGYEFKPKLPETIEWTLPNEGVIKENWPKSKDRSRYLNLTAAHLAAIGHYAEAEKLLNWAADTKELPALTLTTHASLASYQNRWEEAASLSRDALEKDHHNRAAKEILIRALTEQGLTDEALDQARMLVKQHGEDASTLFLLARAANMANSRQEESEALARLVIVGKKTHQPVGVTLTYLGQSYAKEGKRSEALHSFQEALLSPELTGEEKKVIRGIMDHLMQGNLPSTSLPPFKPIP